jgi:hypothetical protein
VNLNTEFVNFMKFSDSLVFALVCECLSSII